MTHDTNPLVSIGVPVYNGSNYLREALDPLVGQTYGNLEIIISDNASTDSTEKICKEYAAKDKRIRYVRQKDNLGSVGNFNFVLCKARGDYFMWASHDDIRDRTFVEKALEKFKNEPDLRMVFCGYERFDEKGKKDVPEKYVSFDTSFSVPVDKDLYGRLKRYILFYWVDGKAAPIYGLWDIRSVRGEKMGKYRDWALDTQLVFRALSRGRADVIDEVLFWKRTDFSRPFRASYLGRILHTIAYRFKRVAEHVFASGIPAFILGIKELTLRQRVKLLFWHFWIVPRLFSRRKT